MKVRTNLVGGIIFMVTGLVLLILLDSQVIVYGEISFLQSAKVIPFVMESLMIIGGVILVIQSLFLKKENLVEIKWSEQKYAIEVIGIFLLFAFMIYYTGFIIGAVVFVLLMFVFFKNRNILEILGLGILSILIFLLFTKVFHVELPGLGGMLL